MPSVLNLTRPSSVIDVGCGTGTWLSVFASHGVADFLGVDGDYVDRTLLEIPADKFLPYDLSQPLALERQFDLVVSLEVAEHLPPSASDTFVESLARLGPVVLFSAAIPQQGGTDHLNEQWPEYWAERFERQGFLAADAIRPLIWTNENVESWYAQNSLLFVQRTHMPRFPALRTVARATKRSLLAKVHPRLFAELATQSIVHRAKGDYYYAEATRLREAEPRHRANLDACGVQVEELRQAASAMKERSAAEIDDLRSQLLAWKAAIEESGRRLEELEQDVREHCRQIELQPAAAGHLAELLDEQSAKIFAYDTDVMAVKESIRQVAIRLDEAHAALQSSTSTAERLQAELQLRDVRIAEQSAVLMTLEQERGRLTSEVDRLVAEVSHWKAAADLPALPLRTLLRGVRDNVARSLRRDKH